MKWCKFILCKHLSHVGHAKSIYQRNVSKNDNMKTFQAEVSIVSKSVFPPLLILWHQQYFKSYLPVQPKPRERNPLAKPQRTNKCTLLSHKYLSSRCKTLIPFPNNYNKVFQKPPKKLLPHILLVTHDQNKNKVFCILAA